MKIRIRNNETLETILEGIQIGGRPVSLSRQPERLNAVVTATKDYLLKELPSAESVELVKLEDAFLGQHIFQVILQDDNSLLFIIIGDGQVIKKDIEHYTAYGAQVATEKQIGFPILLGKEVIKIDKDDTESDAVGFSLLKIPYSDRNSYGNLKDCYAEMSTENFCDLLSDYFHTLCFEWYKEKQKIHPNQDTTLPQIYNERLGLDFKRLRKYTKYVNASYQEEFITLDRLQMKLPNVLEHGEKIIYDSPYFTTVTHGLPVRSNMIVANGKISFLNFRLTEVGHILHDIALLEAEIRTHFLPESITLDQRIKMEQGLQSQLNPTIPANVNVQSIYNIYEIIAHLRRIVRDMMYPQVNHGEFLLASLYCNLWIYSQSHYTTLCREHALIAACMIYQHLSFTDNIRQEP